MSENSIYRDLAERTGGSFLLGVVGPVRTGKSSFIKRFMETLVIPNIENPFSRERAKDELPQSASGRTIMTAEPKFVPEEAAQITLPDGTALSVRLIDCVGYMVEGAGGIYEDGAERMVTTPWFDREVTLTEAAEAGTERVIRDHSSIGIVITTDGSFGELPREAFLDAEDRVIRELQALGKPFVLILNSADPEGSLARQTAEELSGRYNVACLRLNCLQMDEADIGRVLLSVLEEFPLQSVGVFLPDWTEALPPEDALRSELFTLVTDRLKEAKKLKDLDALTAALSENETVSAVQLLDKSLGCGAVTLAISVPRALYYQTLSRETGLEIRGDGDLIAHLTRMAAAARDYEKIAGALESARETGYGVVYPDREQMELAEPQIVRQNGRYGVKLRAGAPVIHLLRTQIETELRPAVGGAAASEDIIGFLLQGFDGDVNRLWESNIFGRSLNELAEEELRARIDRLPEKARQKLADTLRRMINEGCSGLICLLL